MLIGNNPAKPARPIRLFGLFACRTNGLVYLNIPKSACTTIRNIMYYLDSGSYLEDPLAIHVNRQTLLRALEDREEVLRRLEGHHLTFTFLRNPGRRIYSCFVDKIHNVDRRYFGRIREYLIKYYGLKFDDAESVRLDVHRKNFAGFLRFIGDNLSGKTDIRKNYHWQLQQRIIAFGTRDVPLDFIGLVEKLPLHFKRVLKRAKVDLDIGAIPKFNESTEINISLDEIANDEINNLMGKIYEPDFKLYERIKGRTIHLDVTSAEPAASTKRIIA
jgi:sulfotransferase famil protein